jgi:hypothetical protein
VRVEARARRAAVVPLQGEEVQRLRGGARAAESWLRPRALAARMPDRAGFRGLPHARAR